MSICYGEDKLPYIDMGKGYKIRLEYEEALDEKYVEKAKVELRETPEIKEKAIKELKELLRDEKDFVFPMEDPFLVTYLRPCKFYPQSTLERMQKYFKFKLKHKKVCDNLSPESVRTVFEDGLFKYYPLRDKEGRRILYIHGGKNWKPSRVSTNDFFRAVQLSLQAAMIEPMSQINGVSVIMDFEGLSLSQIVHFTPMFAAMLLEWLQECVPLRVKGIYMVNTSFAFNILFKVFKPFIQPKLRKRIHFIGTDWETLGSALGKECLPQRYGGELPVDEIDGKVLIDLLQLFNYQLELVSYAGYGVVDKEILQKMDNAVKETLSFISSKS